MQHPTMPSYTMEEPAMPSYYTMQDPAMPPYNVQELDMCLDAVMGLFTNKREEQEEEWGRRGAT